MSKFTTLIVGAHFRPPAKQLLAALAGGCQLTLLEDNENAYDAAAVKVMLDPQDIPEVAQAELEGTLPDAGLTLAQLMSTGPIQLGFVPAQAGKPLAKARQTDPELLGNLQVRELMPDVAATLGFAIDGSPLLLLETNPAFAEAIKAPNPDIMELNERHSKME